MTTAAERSLIDRDIAHLVHPLHNQAAHESAKVWVGGKGAYIIDSEGNEYIDCLSGLWNNTAGNGRPDSPMRQPPKCVRWDLSRVMQAVQIPAQLNYRNDSLI